MLSLSHVTYTDLQCKGLQNKQTKKKLWILDVPYCPKSRPNNHQPWSVYTRHFSTVFEAINKLETHTPTQTYPTIICCWIWKTKKQKPSVQHICLHDPGDGTCKNGTLPSQGWLSEVEALIQFVQIIKRCSPPLPTSSPSHEDQVPYHSHSHPHRMKMRVWQRHSCRFNFSVISLLLHTHTHTHCVYTCIYIGVCVLYSGPLNSAQTRAHTQKAALAGSVKL